jgi:hypothetical protein
MQKIITIDGKVILKLKLVRQNFLSQTERGVVRPVQLTRNMLIYLLTEIHAIIMNLMFVRYVNTHLIGLMPFCRT